MSLPNYEKLGSFYLGREVDAATGTDKPELVLYDSRDLTTHAVCVGMTGSGKTGLCLSLLEEAAIDGVPAIAIDPKGDIGNLLLTFPELRAEDFAPWVDGGDASRKGMTNEAYAQATAENWRKGLADWDQNGERIRRLRAAADFAIYTPGSTSGRPLSVLRSFAAPPVELRSDPSSLRERIGATVSGLLSLVGVEADPIKSREHILLSTLLEQAWTQGRDLDLKSLIQGIQKPGIDQIGVMDLETFYPAKERLQLAMSLNNLLASPGFSAWMQGEPLDVQRLLFTESGKPRVAIISIAHLNDSERMFVVTLVLGEIVAWMRRQSGTSSLRALFYMDEIFGYFPPTAMPPSKPPLLTLMKQGRAFGLGVVLATQNPVDLDYKGLSNAGTWFIGRLQTERDKARVVEGLIAAGSGIEKSQFDTLLANLTARVFLMRNAHEDAPVLFRSRWAMSYLRGPLTLPEIARLSPNAAAPASTAPVSTASTITSAAKSSKPVVPASVIELFWKGEHNSYAPHLLGQVRMHFVNASAGVDVWETRSYALPLTSDADPDWARATIGGDVRASLDKSGNESATYALLPASATRPESYKAWSRQLESYVYASAELELLSAPVVGATSVPGGSEADFRARIALALREKRDAAVDALRRKYSPKLIALQDQIRRAEDRVSREQSQLTQRKMETAINIGTSILGAFLGRKKISVTNASRIGTAARGAGRLGRDSEDVTRANEGLDVLKQRHEELEGEFNAESARVQAEYEPAAAVIDRVSIKPRKSDIEVTQIALVWMPA
ncbi:MAG: ATP-binding protein [Povalibacter sp.]